jgi:thiol-disulfide isomerase/thioredoxin
MESPFRQDEVMIENTPRKLQINVFACGHCAMAILLMALLAGCGGQEAGAPEDKVPGSTVSEDGPATQRTQTEDGNATVGEARATDQEPESPPGTLELPSDYESSPAATESNANETKSGGIELPPDVGSPADSSSADASTDVKFATWQEIDQFAKSTGRITVIDLWSLACEPCLEEFPGLVKLHQTMGDSVQCVAVDVDYDGRKSRPPEYYQQRVTDFLKSVKASGFPTYISKTPSDDVFNTTKLISIPAVVIYDAKGEVVKKFVDTGEANAFTYEKDVVPFLKSLEG